MFLASSCVPRISPSLCASNEDDKRNRRHGSSRDMEGGGDRDVEELYIGSKEKFSRSDLARSNDK